MFSMAEIWELRPDGSNPCRHIRRYREESRERFLSVEEFRRLGKVLDDVLVDGSESHSAVTAIRLLMLTGCRLSEILTLRWAYVDLAAGELNLLDTKTGGRAVPLAPAAVRLLADLPRKRGTYPAESGARISLTFSRPGSASGRGPACRASGSTT